LLSGAKIIHQAAQNAKGTRAIKFVSKQESHRRPKAPTITDEDALAEDHHILNLLNALSASDPNETCEATFKSAAAMVRQALK